MTDKETKWTQFQISFRQIHTHRYDGITLDADCLAGIDAPDELSVRKFCQTQFNNQYMTIYTKPDLKWFPRGVINIGSIPGEYVTLGPQNDH